MIVPKEVGSYFLLSFFNCSWWGYGLFCVIIQNIQSPVMVRSSSLSSFHREVQCSCYSYCQLLTSDGGKQKISASYLSLRGDVEITSIISHALLTRI